MINKQISNYKIIRKIGEGGMAKVYEAEHINLGNKVAIKILEDNLVNKTTIRQRFKNEAKIMAGLNHPNIVNVIDFVETKEILAIIMEILQGESLTSYIKRKGKLNVNDAIEIQKQILNAFDFAHKNGIVHRDIKPSNIFINETNSGFQVKILDFGIAKLISSDVSLTGTGTQMGTPLYMSPEQVKDAKNIDNLSDIYSLGIVLFYMLNGEAPYDKNTLSKFDIFEKIIYEKLPELKDVGNLNFAIQKATAKKPSERFMTCSEFSKSLVLKEVEEKLIVKPPKVDIEKTVLKTNIDADVMFQKEKTSKIEKPKEENKKGVNKVLLLVPLLIIGLGVYFYLNRDKSFEKIFDNIGIANEGRQIIKTNDGFVLLINAIINKKNNKDIVLLKVDNKGKEIWRKQIGGAGEEVAKAMTKVADGFIIAGYKVYSGENKGLALIVKIDNNGKIVWEKELEKEGWHVAFSVDERESGDLLISGFSQYGSVNSSSMDKDVWVALLDNNGGIIGEDLPLSSSNNEESYSIINLKNDNGFLITGYSIKNKNKDIFLIKYNANNKMEWVKYFGNKFTDKAHKVIQTSDNNYLIAGYHEDRNNNGNMWVLKINKSGKEIWNKKIGGIYKDEAMSIIEAQDDTYYAVGYADKETANKQIYAVHLDYNGDILSEQKIGTSSNDGAWSISEFDKEYLITFGSTNSKGVNNAYLVKFKKENI